jgi:hypothetical protein
MSNFDQAAGASQLPAALRADCSRCVGLCCVAEAFYAVQGFGYDKPARTPCRHLTRANHCGIHTQRTALGFTACQSFDCYGAGQRVTRDLDLAEGWRADSELAERAGAAYTAYLTLHELMALLALAETVVAATLAAPLRHKRAELESLGDFQAARQGTLDTRTLRADVMQLIRTAHPQTG